MRDNNNTIESLLNIDSWQKAIEQLAINATGKSLSQNIKEQQDITKMIKDIVIK